MGVLLFSHFRVTNVKLINEKYTLNMAVSKAHGLHHSVTVSLYLACFVVSTYKIFVWVIWILTTYLFWQRAQKHIYLQDYRRHSVAASQRRNDHMQVYINIMEGKYHFLIWNGLMVDRLIGPRLMSLWNAWDRC